MVDKLKGYYKIISWLIKLTIVVLTFSFLYKQLFIKQDIVAIRKGIAGLLDNPFEYVLFGFVILLMLINWSLEAMKWRLMIKKIEQITFLRSLEAIFSGITVCVFTPNRIGEYGGRIFHLRTANPIKATLVTIIGGFSQLIVTILTGAVSLLFFIPQYIKVSQYLNSLQYYVLVFLFSSSMLLLTYLYINSSFLTLVFNKIKLPISIKKYADIFSWFSPAELIYSLLYSLGRYFVFTLQFFILLRIFGVNIPYSTGMMMISMTYLVMTIIPTIAIAELGIRGAVSLYFIALIAPDNNVGILSASFVLWLVNLAIPAIIGTFFVFDLNFFGQKKD